MYDDKMIKKIEEKIGLDARTAEDAEQGIPPENASMLSDTEKQILSEITEEIDVRLGTFKQKHIEPLEKSCRDLNSELPGDKDGQDESTVNKTAASDAARRLAQKSHAVYEQFRSKHEKILDGRDAKVSDSAVQIGWLAVIVIVEGGLNTWFFAPAGEYGWLSGFFTAFFISFVNVAAAFGGGQFGLRYAFNHRELGHRLGGLAVLLICAGVCLLTVAVAAAYRGQVDSLATQDIPLAQLAKQASDNAVSVAFSFDIRGIIASVDAFVLFFVGCICAIVALRKGYYFNDPCPGYAEKFNARQDAYKNYKHSMEGRIEEIKGLVRAIEAKKKSLGEAHAAEINGLDGFAKHIGCKLLKKYRDKNADMRDTAIAPLPAYFNQTLDPQNIDDNTLVGKYFSNMNKTYGAAEAEITRADKDADDITDRAKTVINKLESKTKSLEEIEEEAESKDK